MERAGTNRRDVLRLCLGACAAVRAPARDKSKVVIARDAALRPSGGAPDSARLIKTLDNAVMGVYGMNSPMEAWKQIARPNEVIGLKVNCLAGRGASTTPALVDAVCERLRQAGLPARNIAIWDRLNDDLDRAGFQVGVRRDGIRAIGNDVSDYEPELSVFGEAGSRVTRTLTQVCDAFINLPVLKDHGIVGVTMALKNMFGAIHNPNKYHTNAGDPYVADVNMFPAIRRKMRLTICDAIAPQYEGGPSYMPHWSWPYQGVIASRDPVALDYTGWQIVEKQRAAKGLPSLKAARREPLYIARAADAKHALGTNDPGMIEVVET